MSDMAAKPRTEVSRYVVERHPHGYLVVSRRDEKEMTHQEYVWLKNVIALSLRAERIGEQRNPSLAARADEVDEVIKFLADQHSERRIPFKAFVDIMQMHPTTLSELSKGRRRGYLDVVRPWAYFLGFDIVAIPLSLGKVVRDLVTAHLKTNTLNTSVFEEDNGNRN